MASNAAVSGQGLYNKARQFLSKKKTRTYILPTGFGVAFGLMSLVLFFMAVGYSNNLIYIFFFFLISVAFTGTFITNKNVDGVDVIDVHVDEAFCDETSALSVTLKNNAKSPCFQIESYFEKYPETSSRTDLEPQEEDVVLVPFVFKKRGRHLLPRIAVQSTFPFSLLRAWRVFKTPREITVYPARKGEEAFPQNSYAETDSENTGLFREHRTYQSTDSLRRIDWKATARRQELLVKNFEESEKPSLHFSWRQTAHLHDEEARISQLCLWIDEAHKLGHSFSLEVGKHHIAKDQSSAHRKMCLEVLAHLSREDLL
ncbi:DUF58 domain-containing protein [Bdellovibrio bacteriovorus]|uniref:DUF58 domain-containing protein n=1 Tax=Bdellovibrio bacteriovorus TaxID=959 RepID=UPI0035A5A3A5